MVVFRLDFRSEVPELQHPHCATAALALVFTASRAGIPISSFQSNQRVILLPRGVETLKMLRDDA